MIKQSKIKSFISLIEKAHSPNRKEQTDSFKTSHQQLQLPRQSIFEKQPFNNHHNFSQSGNLGLQSTHYQFKDSFQQRMSHMLLQSRRKDKDQKSNLYEVYCRSLQKRQSYYNIRDQQKQRNYSHHANLNHKQSLPSSKYINFPIKRPRKTSKPHAVNYKLMKKRQLTSPNPINRMSHQTPKRLKTESSPKDLSLQRRLNKILGQGELQLMKIDSICKQPLFRIKKCPQISIEHQIAQKIKLKTQEQQYRSTKMCIPLKDSWKCLSSEPQIQKANNKGSKGSAIKKSQRYLKRLQKSIALDRVDPWDYEDKEGIQLFEEG